MTINKNEAERLAQAINALRPNWPTNSIRNMLYEHRHKPYLDTALALTYIALDPDSRTPARINNPGPWHNLNHPNKPTPQPPQLNDGNHCHICFRHRHRHDHNNDHPFTPIATNVGTKRETNQHETRGDDDD